MAFVVGNALSIPAKDESKDLVWCEDSFSHIPPKIALLRQCHRVLKPGGRLVFSDLLSAGRLDPTTERQFERAWCLSRLETLDGYLNLLSQAGFEGAVGSRVGSQVLQEHRLAESRRGDTTSTEYIRWLRENETALREQWGFEAFACQMERLNMYDYLEAGKLEHGFFAARK